jgi:hypothetical protein
MKHSPEVLRLARSPRKRFELSLQASSGNKVPVPPAEDAQRCGRH